MSGVPLSSQKRRSSRTRKLLLYVIIFLVFFLVGSLLGGLAMIAFAAFATGNAKVGIPSLKDVFVFLNLALLYVWPFSLLLGGLSAFSVAVTAVHNFRKTCNLFLAPLLIVTCAMWVVSSAFLYFVLGVSVPGDRSMIAAYLLAHLAATFLSWLICRGLLRFVFADRIHA